MDLIGTINPVALTWAQWMWASVLESTVIFLMIGCLWLFVRRRPWMSPQFGYWLFLLVLLKLVFHGQISAPNLLLSFFPQENTVFISQGMGFHWWGDPQNPDALGTEKVTPTAVDDSSRQAEREPLSIVSFFMFFWFTIIVVLSACLFWVERWNRRLLRLCRPMETPHPKIDFDRLQRLAGVKQTIRWVTNSKIQSPMTFGILRPTIAVPEGFADAYTQNQVHWILLHELAHIKRGDVLVSSLQKILHIVFFFHPVVWFTNFIINQLREYACDDIALSITRAKRKECGEGFLSLVVQTNYQTSITNAIGIVNYDTMIRRRLMRILDNQRLLQKRLSVKMCVTLFAITLVVMLYSASNVAAQVGEWIKVSNEGPGVAYHGMIYDPIRDKVVLYGGSSTNSSQNYDDMWELDGNTWTRTARTSEPTDARNFRMAYDSKRGRIVLHNAVGYPDCGTLWVWDGVSWQIASTSGPSWRWEQELVYDSKRDRIVMFGGTSVNGLTSPFFQETWEWDGTTWTKITEDGPPARIYSAMVYDSARGRTVLYGGVPNGDYGSGPSNPGPDSGQTALGDTWEWDGSTWTQVALTGNTPGPRTSHAMVYDTHRKKTILYGGVDKVDYFDFSIDLHLYTDLWEWDGYEWKQIDSIGMEPAGRAAHKMAYDSKRNRIILHGGVFGIIPKGNNQRDFLSDRNTWVYRFGSSGIPLGLWSQY